MATAYVEIDWINDIVLCNMNQTGPSESAAIKSDGHVPSRVGKLRPMYTSLESAFAAS
jgi:hypothetical protein